MFCKSHHVNKRKLKKTDICMCSKMEMLCSFRNNLYAHFSDFVKYKDPRFWIRERISAVRILQVSQKLYLKHGEIWTNKESNHLSRITKEI